MDPEKEAEIRRRNEQSPLNTMTPHRATARDLLRHRIEQLRSQARALEALDKALPLELAPDADAGLLNLLNGG
jgi:hypothetical protein